MCPECEPPRAGLEALARMLPLGLLGLRGSLLKCGSEAQTKAQSHHPDTHSHQKAERPWPEACCLTLSHSAVFEVQSVTAPRLRVTSGSQNSFRRSLVLSHDRMIMMSSRLHEPSRTPCRQRFRQQQQLQSVLWQTYLSKQQQARAPMSDAHYREHKHPETT